MNRSPHGPLRVGIGGPVGSGKTALVEASCRHLRGRHEIAAITNDIYTREDAEILTRSGALPPERILGVETGGCPHTAIREDASINLAAIDQMLAAFPKLDLIFIESGGDNLAATFSPADLTIYVIDVSAGDKIPRKGRPRDHPLRPPGDQQNRPCAPGWRRPGRDGARRKADARRRAVRVHQHPCERWRAGGLRIHQAAGGLSSE